MGIPTRDLGKLSKDLGEILRDVPAPLPRVELDAEQRKILRSLKTQGERATKGREVKECTFGAKRNRDGGISLTMIMEGRHSMSVGRQVARLFEGRGSVEVAKTRAGACVILRLEEGDA